MAVTFALVTAALAVAALGPAFVPSPLTSGGASALLFTVATAYLLSRTSGIPGLTDHPEPFDTLGTTTSLVEAATAVVTGVMTVRQTNPRRH